ncbi:hypothetical protein SUNI508_09103 [Seiridium unicorne]|uniref:Uncharacterized protein n=1 Tax=Seiridium unicorne TaxID=138068 RepID=A0ABR2UR08_9PEZI
MGTNPDSPPSRPIPALASLKGSEPVDDLEASPVPEDAGTAAHTWPRDVFGFRIRFGEPEVSSAVSVVNDQAFVRFGWAFAIHPVASIMSYLPGTQNHTA